MIISASRRTDIPAFYSDWFMNRIRAGYCTTPNPYKFNQVSKVSLAPNDVDVIVFWTRNPKPMAGHLDELDSRGYRYYFQFTILDNPKALDPHTPPASLSAETFRALSRKLGPDRVIWRYDPIVLTTETGVEYHLSKFAEIADLLRGYTRRVVISLVDIYKSISSRMGDLKKEGIQMIESPPSVLARLFGSMTNIAAQHDMDIQSCAEDLDLQSYGVKPGKCIDDSLIRKIFKISVASKKDPSQRKPCGCVVSKDIGMYDTCPFNCLYCYATRDFNAVRKNRAKHDPQSPSLIGWHEPTTPFNEDQGDDQLPLL